MQLQQTNKGEVNVEKVGATEVEVEGRTLGQKRQRMVAETMTEDRSEEKERWLVGDTDGVCLVLVYFKNTVGNKANKHCGEVGRYR